MKFAYITSCDVTFWLGRNDLSRRDTADVLGISHQRVQQLLAS